MTISSRIVYLISCVMVLSDPGLAAPAVDPVSGPIFSTLCWDKTPVEKLFYRHEDQIRVLEFGTSSRSKPFPLAGEGVFELYRETPPPPEGTEEELPPFTLISRTALPASPQILLLFFVREQDGRPQYRIFPMDDSLKTFPRGTFRFINFHHDPLFVRCDETLENIPPNGTIVLKSSKSDRSGFVPFLVGNQDGDVLFRTQIYGQVGGRELVFIIPPLEGVRRPRIKYISELLPEPLPEDSP